MVVVDASLGAVRRDPPLLAGAPVVRWSPAVVSAVSSPAADVSFTFDDMAVTDPDDLVSGDFLDEVRVTVATFAEQTGWDGVSVPEVKDVEPERLRSGAVEWDGDFRGARVPIRVTADIPHPQIGFVNQGFEGPDKRAHC